jgi:hypothetical protein
MQETPAGAEEVENARQFIAAIRKAADEFLPQGRFSLKIKEEYDHK